MFRLSALSCVAVLAMATAAAAQASYPYSLTLYEGLDYQGASVTFFGDNANIGSTGFAARARSAQIRGAWRLCEGGGYRLRCEVLNANIRDLDSHGFAGRVGSAQSLNPPPSAFAQPAGPPPAPAPYRPALPPVQGRPAPAPVQPPVQAQPRPQPRPVARPLPAPAPRQTFQAEAPPARAPAQAAPAPAAPAPAAPAYVAPRPARGYEPIPEPPAVDAPLAGPGRFDRYERPPVVAAAPARTAPAPRAPRPQAPAPSPVTYGDADARGGSAVFFASPTVRGADVAAFTPGAADAFCRAQGLSGAIYFDQSRSEERSVEVDGRVAGEGPVLRDVLCRR
jgi:hypothetical protein